VVDGVRHDLPARLRFLQNLDVHFVHYAAQQRVYFAMQRLAGFLGDLLVGFLEHRRRGDGLFVAPFGFQIVDGKLIGVNDLDDEKGQSGVVLREPHRFRKGCFG
ncbi:hypothetical protein, partial [Eggerthella lenta]|uniref:hypothetical protein n=1 Tax=Eggerthella lenta TaxID=84112 RepID=UPI00210A92EC